MIRPLRAADATALAVIAATAVAACSGLRQPGAASYYRAQGDSLSRGVQPDAASASVEAPQGYPDFVYARHRPGHPALKLEQLRCPGETTLTLVRSGACRYRGGSQLAAAGAFLRAHHGHMFLVTIDIGANDPEHRISRPSLAGLAFCVGYAPRAAAPADYRVIANAVRKAAGLGVTGGR